MAHEAADAGAPRQPLLDSVAVCPDLAPLLVAKGKVREIYDLGDGSLLFVATDRVSAFDIVMKTPVPDKGRVLTSISVYWLRHLAPLVPNHLLSESIDAEGVPGVVAKYRATLEGRIMRVRKLRMLPIEVIVRGYLSGSAWKEYRERGTVHGIQMPAGMTQNQRLPEPMYTPSTKAAVGDHDENIHPDKAAEIIGSELAAKVKSAALTLFTHAAAHALERGLVLADTKFEFGLDEQGGLFLGDEVLTPDSSRFWPSRTGGAAGVPESLDKQFLRDYLIHEAGISPAAGSDRAGRGGSDGVELPAHIVDGLRERYAAAEQMLTGQAEAQQPGHSEAPVRSGRHNGMRREFRN